MGMTVQERGDRAQLRVTHALLERAFFATFETRAAAQDYGNRLLALLARGIVPVELTQSKPKGQDDLLLLVVMRDYIKGNAALTDSDEELLGFMYEELRDLRLSDLVFTWVEEVYVRRLKFERHLAPSSIRKRVEVLGRVLDWHHRRTTTRGEQLPANPFRMLQRGYSVYSRADAEALEATGRAPKVDVERDRRLAPAEELSIRAVLNGEKRADRERAFPAEPELALLFDLLVDTGLRLSEAYRLRVDQVDLARGLLRVEGSKGHRGKAKPRVVPMRPRLAALLRARCANRVGLLFPYWDGTEEDERKASARLSNRMVSLFTYAGVADLSAHDLRHEATCRWVELRLPAGGWTFSEIELCKIMGWSSTKMMLRYASLRGEDWSARLA